MNVIGDLTERVRACTKYGRKVYNAERRIISGCRRDGMGWDGMNARR